MTLFGLYRILEFPGKVNLSTIIDFPKVDCGYYLSEYSHFICQVFRPLVLRTFKGFGIWEIGFRGKPLKAAAALKCAPFVISSTTPSATKVKGYKGNSILSTSPAGILLSVKV
jgi:hypothetical protein